MKSKCECFISSFTRLFSPSPRATQLARLRSREVPKGSTPIFSRAPEWQHVFKVDAHVRTTRCTRERRRDWLWLKCAGRRYRALEEGAKLERRKDIKQALRRSVVGHSRTLDGSCGIQKKRTPKRLVASRHITPPDYGEPDCTAYKQAVTSRKHSAVQGVLGEQKYRVSYFVFLEQFRNLTLQSST